MGLRLLSRLLHYLTNATTTITPTSSHITPCTSHATTTSFSLRCYHYYSRIRIAITKCCGKLEANPRYHIDVETAAAAIVLWWKAWCTGMESYSCCNCCRYCYCTVVGNLMQTNDTILVLKLLMLRLLYCFEKLDSQPRYHTYVWGSCCCRFFFPSPW